MFERLTQDGRNATMTTASGVGIAFGGAPALRSWQAAQEQVSAEPQDRIARQNGAIRRLAALFGSQPVSSPFRSAIQIGPD